MNRLLVPLFFFLACSDSPPTTPETRPVENPNAGNTAIYDVDPDDPYEIGSGSFMDMRPGDTVDTHSDWLTPGTLVNGEGEFDVYYILGRRSDTLGYVYSADERTIESIIIESTDAVTQDGIRVGNTFGELTERLGVVDVIGSEIEARVYATKAPFRYRLGMNSGPGPVDTSEIDPATPILTIEID
ncbi:MAG: hypothetical protein WA952_13995 [Lewinella sp.]